MFCFLGGFGWPRVGTWLNTVVGCGAMDAAPVPHRVQHRVGRCDVICCQTADPGAFGSLLRLRASKVTWNSHRTVHPLRPRVPRVEFGADMPRVSGRGTELRESQPRTTCHSVRPL